MSNRISKAQREAVLQMLARGEDRQTIAATIGISPGQVSAVAAHLSMGTYRSATGNDLSEPPGPERKSTTANMLRDLTNLQTTRDRIGSLNPILLGSDLETGVDVLWNPDPETGAANPHVLVLGESGFGKTYTVSCLLAELVQQQVPSVVFDYGQGFSLEVAPKAFVKSTKPVEIQASKEGIDINPLQIFPSDLHGPLNVAQRVADTFSRVYSQIGVQQHAVLRQAVLDVMAQEGIVPDRSDSWSADLPWFENLRHKLAAYASDATNSQRRIAASVSSHISTMFVFNTFRPNGRKIAWLQLLDTRDRAFIIQLKGLEYPLERAVTEFLLWSLIGFIESLGPGRLRSFVVLDEAHKLSFDRGSPVEKLLREGRKFGPRPDFGLAAA